MKEVTLRMSEVEALQKLYYGCATPSSYDALHGILARAEALRDDVGQHPRDVTQPPPANSAAGSDRPLGDRIKAENG